MQIIVDCVRRQPNITWRKPDVKVKLRKRSKFLSLSNFNILRYVIVGFNVPLETQVISETIWPINSVVSLMAQLLYKRRMSILSVFPPHSEQAVRLGGRHNMPPPSDFDFWPWSRCGSRMCQNAEKRCICHPKIQIYTNIFKFKTGVLCYVRQVAALLVLATICSRPVTLTFGVLCYKEI